MGSTLATLRGADFSDEVFLRELDGNGVVSDNDGGGDVPLPDLAPLCFTSDAISSSDEESPLIPAFDASGLAEPGDRRMGGRAPDAEPGAGRMGGRAPDAEPGAGDEPLPLPGAVDLGSEGETAAKASSVAELAPLPVADIRAELDLVLASGLGGSELRRAELAPVTRLDLVLASELRRAELAPLPLPVASGTSGLGGSESEDLFSGLTAPAGSATGTAVLSSGFSSRLAFTF